MPTTDREHWTNLAETFPRAALNSDLEKRSQKRSQEQVGLEKRSQKRRSREALPEALEKRSQEQVGQENH